MHENNNYGSGPSSPSSMSQPNPVTHPSQQVGNGASPQYPSQPMPTQPSSSHRMPQPQYSPIPPQTQKPRTISMKLWQFILCLIISAFGGAIAFIVFAMILTAMSPSLADKSTDSSSSSSSNSSILKDAYNTCGDSYYTTLSLGDNGKSLTLKQSSDATSNVVSCIARELNIPDATLEKMSQTTAYSGTQYDSWDNIEATWSYNGAKDYDNLVIVFEIKG